MRRDYQRRWWSGRQRKSKDAEYLDWVMEVLTQGTMWSSRSNDQREQREVAERGERTRSQR